MRAIACVLVLVTSLFCSSAFAAVDGDGTIIGRYAITPASATATTPLVASIDLLGCIPVEPVLRVFEVTSSNILLGFEVLDYCDQSLEPRTQTYPLGTLPAGHYDVVYMRCFGNVLPGEEPCSIAGTESITIRVAPVPGPALVPTLSPEVVTALILLAGGIATVRLRQT